MSRLAILALLVAVAVAQETCIDVPEAQRYKKMEGCTDKPAKACSEGGVAPDFSTFEFFDNNTKFNWENDGYRECKARIELCKDKTYAEKVTDAGTYCAAECNTALRSVCIKKVLNNWNGWCANHQEDELREDGCKKDSKFYKYPTFCDYINAAVKDGGVTCSDNKECNGEWGACYDQKCGAAYDWCHTARWCWDQVQAKTVAAEGDTNCIKGYMAPWNAASTFVPSALVLVAVLLAL